MSDTAERILAAIAKSTSQRPARAADVAAQVGGPEPEFWAAIERLTQTRSIATAHIHRPATDPQPWLAIWPTGVCVAVPMSGNTLSGLFVRHRPLRAVLAETQAPRVRTSTPSAPPAAAPAPTTRKEKTTMASMAPNTDRLPPGGLKRRLLDALRASEAPLTCNQLALLVDRSVENVRLTCKTLTRDGLIECIPENGKQAWRLLPAQGATAPEPAAKSGPEAPIEALVAEESAEFAREDAAATAAPPRIDFALWPDGRLDIVDGDELIQIPPRDVARLALLLGVPGAAFPQLTGA